MRDLLTELRQALPTWLPLIFSMVSLLVSVMTMWLTQFRRGTIKMTQPSFVCMTREKPSMVPKLFFRTLLYSTASKGCGVEQLYAVIKTEYGTYLFDFWGATEGRELMLGSGLHVAQAGHSANHHFNPRRDANEFLFAPGVYHVGIFARLVGRTKPLKVSDVEFEVATNQAGYLAQIPDLDLCLYRDPRTGRYESELRRNNEVFLTELPRPPSWSNLGGDSALDEDGSTL